MQDVVPFGQIFYCTARCKQGRDTITKKILLLGKRLNAKRDELGDSRPLGHRKHYTKISLERLLHRILARITNAPARLGCAEPPWTSAIGFARRDPAAPPTLLFTPFDLHRPFYTQRPFASERIDARKPECPNARMLESPNARMLRRLANEVYTITREMPRCSIAQMPRCCSRARNAAKRC